MATYRKTRFVCVSDTHSYTPSEAGFRLPPGDVLIHAGDLTKQGSKSELQRTMQWIQDADYEVKIVVAGNHDVTLDAPFYAEHGPEFHNQKPENAEECMELVQGSPSVIFLRHASALVKLTRLDGPRTVFKVFGSPYSRFQGVWAFGYDTAEEAQRLWDQIPLDVDIVVTHTPPSGYCDHRREDGDKARSLGCDGLRQALSRVRPMLAVCGHVHEGRGYERVRWDDDDDGATRSAQEAALPPMGSKKQSLIDLTGRKHRRLDNTSISVSYTEAATHGTVGTITNGPTPEGTISARKETCIVNAAIMATSFPHKEGKQFHKPIVVDLELPAWDSLNPT